MCSPVSVKDNHTISERHLLWHDRRCCFDATWSFRHGLTYPINRPSKRYSPTRSTTLCHCARRRQPCNQQVAPTTYNGTTAVVASMLLAPSVMGGCVRPIDRVSDTLVVHLQTRSTSCPDIDVSKFYAGR
jgi:hypothetical protein